MQVFANVAKDLLHKSGSASEALPGGQAGRIGHQRRAYNPFRREELPSDPNRQASSPFCYKQWLVPCKSGGVLSFPGGIADMAAHPTNPPLVLNTVGVHDYQGGAPPRVCECRLCESCAVPRVGRWMGFLL